MTVAADDLCECNHDGKDHINYDGKCEGLDGYMIPCTCPSFTPAQVDPDPEPVPVEETPFGEITVQHHVASDKFFVVSKNKDEGGVPLLMMQVDRATIDGGDERKEFAKFLYGIIKAAYKGDAHAT